MTASNGFVPHGKHLIAGTWVAGSDSFASAPAVGPSHRFSVGTPTHVDMAVQAAEVTFETYGRFSPADRAAFLKAIENGHRWGQQSAQLGISSSIQIAMNGGAPNRQARRNLTGLQTLG